MLRLVQLALALPGSLCMTVLEMYSPVLVVSLPVTVDARVTQRGRLPPCAHSQGYKTFAGPRTNCCLSIILQILFVFYHLRLQTAASHLSRQERGCQGTPRVL